jgi:hypothetical protein
MAAALACVHNAGRFLELKEERRPGWIRTALVSFTLDRRTRGVCTCCGLVSVTVREVKQVHQVAERRAVARNVRIGAGRGIGEIIAAAMR